ncbi:MAG: hypothetical protein JW746_09810 [Candidatus Krumholzibacteriota bacterium]|nr:hypothetical protein [Candidatus Krumholzibacteriota bacterium]
MRLWLYMPTVVMVILGAFCAEAAGYGHDAVFEGEPGRNKESLSYSELEVFLSFSVSRPQLRGDFDGLTFFEGAGLVLLVPEVNPGPGFGAALGVKRRLGRNLRNALGAEFYCVRSSHDGLWAGLPGEGVLWDVGASLSWHFYADCRVQPYFKGTMGFTGFDFDLDDDLEVDT